MKRIASLILSLVLLLAAASAFAEPVTLDTLSCQRNKVRNKLRREADRAAS